MMQCIHIYIKQYDDNIYTRTIFVRICSSFKTFTFIDVKVEVLLVVLQNRFVITIEISIRISFSMYIFLINKYVFNINSFPPKALTRSYRISNFDTDWHECHICLETYYFWSAFWILHHVIRFWCSTIWFSFTL